MAMNGYDLVILLILLSDLVLSRLVLKRDSKEHR